MKGLQCGCYGLIGQQQCRWYVSNSDNPLTLYEHAIKDNEDHVPCHIFWINTVPQMSTFFLSNYCLTYMVPYDIWFLDQANDHGQ